MFPEFLVQELQPFRFRFVEEQVRASQYPCPVLSVDRDLVDCDPDAESLLCPGVEKREPLGEGIVEVDALVGRDPEVVVQVLGEVVNHAVLQVAGRIAALENLEIMAVEAVEAFLVPIQMKPLLSWKMLVTVLCESRELMS